MKTRILITCFSLLLIVTFVFESFAEDNQDQFTEAKLEWSQYNYKIQNGTGTAKIIVTDHDMNKISNYIDTVEVFAYSDSFPEGITITLYETLKDSGVFERTFTLSENRSAPSILYVKEGDTAIITYTDSTLPSDHVFSEIHLMETTLIGSKGPPLERVPASNARLTDVDQNPIESPIVGKQILLTSDIANQQDHTQNFVWIAQVTDEQKRIVSLSWINGILNPESSFSSSTSWIPQREGKYSVVFFVWESLTNPSALSPPIDLEFTVAKEQPIKNKIQKEITIEVGNAVNNKGLLPIITTETTSNTESLDFITDWNFLPLNHGEWGPLGDRLSWDTISRENKIHNFTGISSDEMVQLESSFARNAILHIYDANCQGEKIEMLSADPIPITIPDNLSSVSVTTSEAGLLPVNGLYTLKFASFFDQNVILPENVVIISNEKKRCAVDHEDYPSGEYVNVVFRLEGFPDDFEFNYSFGVGGKNSYNSKNTLYVSDMVCDDPIVTPIPLTETEKTIIWESISENNFFQMSDYTENCDSSGNCILVEPETLTTLFVIADGIKHSVTHRESFFGKTVEPLSHFNNIIDTITEIFEQKDELKFLPKPRCAYL